MVLGYEDINDHQQLRQYLALQTAVEQDCSLAAINLWVSAPVGMAEECSKGGIMLIQMKYVLMQNWFTEK